MKLKETIVPTKTICCRCINSNRFNVFIESILGRTRNFIWWRYPREYIRFSHSNYYNLVYVVQDKTMDSNQISLNKRNIWLEVIIKCGGVIF
jgi:hypothetical protein